MALFTKGGGPKPEQSKTVTPTATGFTVTPDAGKVLSSVVVNGDADLVTNNIKSGVNIFGVAGNSNVVDTSAGDATAAQILSGKKAYVDGALVTGTIPSKTAQTYTPGTSNQTISAGQYLSGAQTISGDADLVSANIKSGANIFGVAGAAAVVNTSDANAVAGEILSTKTAYVNGSKITGTIASKAAATYTPGTSNQTISAGQYLSGVQTISGDANLVTGNIAAGVNIFGVAGAYPVFTAGTNTLALKSTQCTAYSGSYKKVSEFLINKTGTYRVSFQLWCSPGASELSFGRIFKNGTAVGIERSNRYIDIVTYTEDFSFTAGDYCQLYLKSWDGEYPAYSRNFKIAISTNYLGSIPTLTL